MIYYLFGALVVVLVATQADAKVTIPVKDIETEAGRATDEIKCDNASAVWKIGFQETKAKVLDETWEDLPEGDRFVLTRSGESSSLQIKPVTYKDRSNIKCSYVVAEVKNGTETGALVNKDVYFRIRVRDPLGAVWPTVGICVEAVVLFIVIYAFEYFGKQSGSK